MDENHKAEFFFFFCPLLVSTKKKHVLLLYSVSGQLSWNFVPGWTHTYTHKIQSMMTLASKTWTLKQPFGKIHRTSTVNLQFLLMVCMLCSSFSLAAVWPSEEAHSLLFSEHRWDTLVLLTLVKGQAANVCLEINKPVTRLSFRKNVAKRF